MHRFSNHCCSLVATFSSFSHTTKFVCMWSPTHQVFVYFWGVPALLIHRAISLPSTRPLNTNKRAMLLLVAMDHGCPDIVWCSWGMLKLSRSLCVFKASLSLSHTQRHLPFQALKQPFLISFHTHFLTKTGKVRGWREGKDAFTQFSTGHPSLCCFCPRLTLYAVPFQPGAPHPHQTNLPIPYSE